MVVFIKILKKELFNANFEAWKYGPIEIDFRQMKKDPKIKFEKFNIFLSKEESKYLFELTCDLLTKTSPWMLVDISYETLA